MQLKRATVLMILMMVCFTACEQEMPGGILYEAAGYDFAYRLAKPDQTWKLPLSLVEISGIATIDADRLACVQDEKGVIFVFNVKSGAVEREILFGDNGDYEGIEVVDRDAWILKSNGTLTHVPDFLQDGQLSVSNYPTALSRKNDTEGLAYDPMTGNLLIACKEHPFLDKRAESGFRAVYSFHSESFSLDHNPLFLISTDTLQLYREKGVAGRPGGLPLTGKGEKAFQPSGIAIHPVSGDIFILASVGKLLVVLSRGGEILALADLRTAHFPKPEGICFGSDGTLFISSEGSLNSGTIHQFKP
jgi:hypothetical protein